MLSVIVASGDVVDGDAAWLERADHLIAADRGAETLDRLARRPDVLVGDMDSVSPELLDRLAAAGSRIERHPADKDASDTELAIDEAYRAGATAVVLLGAIGGRRLDHELANLLLLADPDHAARDLRAVRGATTVRAVGAGRRLELEGAIGSIVTLLPVGGDAVGVTTHGLRWPLEDAVLRLGRSRGLSNEITTRPAAVTVRDGTLLAIETPNEEEPS